MVLTRATCLAAADIAALQALWPDWRTLTAGLLHPHLWLAEAGTDQALAALAGAALWVVAAWFGASLGVVIGSLVPGRFGAALNHLAVSTVPASVRRAVIGTAAAAVVLAPLPAMAAPLDQGGSNHVAAPAIPWPTDSAPSVKRSSVQSTPAPPHRPAAHATPPKPTHTHTHTRSVTVAAGDSLWRLAAAELGPHASARQIAARWPQWHAQNRAVIGTDPDLIVPGTRLTIPNPEESP